MRTDFEILYREFERLSNFYLSQRIDEPLEPPENIQININFKCNLRCSICSIGGREMKVPELTFDEVKRIIDESADFKIRNLILLGGEPFLREDILKIVDYAEEKGISATIITNGTLIDKNLAEKIVASSLSHIQFSIDGMKKGHEAIRGKGTFDRIINAIDLINSFIVKNKNKKLTLGANFTISHSNINEMVPFLNFFEKKYEKKNPELSESGYIKKDNIDLFSILYQPLVSNNSDPQAAKKNPETVLPSQIASLEKNIDKIIAHIKLYKKMKRFSILRDQTIEHLNEIRKYFNKEINLGESKCYAGFNRLMITQYGQFYLCGSVFGNARTDSIREIWYSKEAEDARKMIKKCKSQCVNFCQYLRYNEMKMESFEKISKIFFQEIIERRTLSFEEKREFILRMCAHIKNRKSLVEYKKRSSDNITKSELNNLLSELSLSYKFLAKEAKRHKISLPDMPDLFESPEFVIGDSDTKSFYERAELRESIAKAHKENDELLRRLSEIESSLAQKNDELLRLRWQFSELLHSRGYRYILKPIDRAYRKIKKLINY